MLRLARKLSGGGALLGVVVLSLAAAPAAWGQQNDANSGGDAGNTFSTATPIQVDVGYYASLTTSPVDQDWYRFYAESGLNFDCVLYPGYASQQMSLYDPTGALVTYAISSQGGGPVEFNFTADMTGEWRIQFFYPTPGIAYAYNFMIDTTSSSGTGGGGGGGCGMIGFEPFFVFAAIVGWRRLRRRRSEVDPVEL